jgi:hypothetical protein
MKLNVKLIQNMKKSFYLIAMAMMLCVTSYAQQTEGEQPVKKWQAPTAEQMAKVQAERMKQQYLLGNDQYEKVYKLCLKRAEKQIARMQEMKKEKEQMNAEMKKILNETQYERYEQNQNRSKHMMRRGMQQRGRFHQQGAWNRQAGWQRQQWQPQGQMPMPQQQFQPGPQIDKQTQQQARRRPAMYDDTRKLNEGNSQISTENNTQK